MSIIICPKCSQGDDDKVGCAEEDHPGAEEELGGGGGQEEEEQFGQPPLDPRQVSDTHSPGTLSESGTKQSQHVIPVAQFSGRFRLFWLLVLNFECDFCSAAATLTTTMTTPTTPSCPTTPQENHAVQIYLIVLLVRKCSISSSIVLDLN